MILHPAVLSLPDRADCAFYTCIDLPDGERVDDAQWDYRGRVGQYLGDYPLAGKHVLDYGTASGQLAFYAEEVGSTHVVALEALDSSEFQRIPFTGSLFTEDRERWIMEDADFLDRLKRSFWYGWRKRRSAVEVVYANPSALRQWDRRFDVVIAGALIEHVSDPVAMISSLARLAGEALIIAFTPAGDTDELLMRPMNDWANPDETVSWWELSRGLYQRLFTNLGFNCRLVPATATLRDGSGEREVVRWTIIATRPAPLSATLPRSIPQQVL